MWKRTDRIQPIAGALIVLLAGAAAAAAQDAVADEQEAKNLQLAVDPELLRSDVPTQTISRDRPSNRDWKGPVLNSLHAATVVTQMLDVHSTMKGIENGAVEANQVMGGLVNNRVAFIGVKAGISAGVIFVTHKMAKDNKVAAIVTSAAINCALVMVARHNYKVAQGLQ